MAHVVAIEDNEGQLVDMVYYCSDGCARSHPGYAGWCGCHEIHDAPEWCASCGDALGYWRDGTTWVSPRNQETERAVRSH